MSKKTNMMDGNSKIAMAAIGAILIGALFGPAAFVLALIGLAAFKLSDALGDKKDENHNGPTQTNNETHNEREQAAVKQITDKIKAMKQDYEKEIAAREKENVALKNRMIEERQKVADAVAKQMIEEMKEHAAKMRTEMKYEGESKHGNLSPSSSHRTHRNTEIGK